MKKGINMTYNKIMVGSSIPEYFLKPISFFRMAIMLAMNPKISEIKDVVINNSIIILNKL